MKKVLIVISGLILSACSLPKNEGKNEGKTVIDKISPNENRLSRADLIFGQGSITKTETVYYLVAEDATVCEVGMTNYFKVKIGQKYSCFWMSK